MSKELSDARLLVTMESPYVSEKTTIETEKKNTYAFKVSRSATKGEIKNAVEQLLKAKVKSVNTLNTQAKVKTFKGKKGKRQSWKKAYVTLYPDSKIDLITQ